VEQKLLISKFS